MRRLCAGLAVLSVAGCQVAQPPNPNNLEEAGKLKYETLRRNLRASATAFNARKQRGEITEAQYRAYLADAANELLKGFDLKNVEPDRAYIVADALATAQRWPEAERMYKIAVETADKYRGAEYMMLGRWVADSLQLARVYAHQGKLDEAISSARSIFIAPGAAKAPVLPAVLYEIVPPAKGKGKDFELGELLEDAIAQHDSVIVDAKTKAGKDFLRARPFHIRAARVEAAKLFVATGNVDRARQVLSRAPQAASI